jgi:hypothetical protein
MDTVGLVLSAALCLAAFALFDLVIRLLGDAVGEIRYTVVPTLVGGMHAWREHDMESGHTPSLGPSDGPGLPPGDAVGRMEPGRDPGLIVPVAPVTRHGARCAAA